MTELKKRWETHTGKGLAGLDSQTIQSCDKDQSRGATLHRLPGPCGVAEAGAGLGTASGSVLPMCVLGSWTALHSAGKIWGGNCGNHSYPEQDGQSRSMLSKIITDKIIKTY